MSVKNTNEVTLLMNGMGWSTVGDCSPKGSKSAVEAHELQSWMQVPTRSASAATSSRRSVTNHCRDSGHRSPAGIRTCIARVRPSAGLRRRPA